MEALKQICTEQGIKLITGLPKLGNCSIVYIAELNLIAVRKDIPEEHISKFIYHGFSIGAKGGAAV